VDQDSRPRTIEGLEINEVADGYVVYDPARDRIHYLNHTAVVVLELCNGGVTAGELARLVQTAYDLPEPPVAEVGDCLDRLVEEGLVR
jgi:hypothetical protein